MYYSSFPIHYMHFTINSFEHRWTAIDKRRKMKVRINNIITYMFIMLSSLF